MIKGRPGVLHAARAFADSGAGRARSARAAAIQATHARILDLAMKDPEWAEIVDGIAYQDHGGKVTFGFAKNHPAAARAHELEYGTPTESAHSIFRKVLVGQRPEIERNFKRGMP